MEYNKIFNINIEKNKNKNLQEKMMYISYLFIFLSFLSMISSLNITWDDYLNLFPGIKVNDKSEFHFGENLKFIIASNREVSSYKLGINQFTHLSTKEWKLLFFNMTSESRDETVFSQLNLRSTPTSWDWRDHGVTTPVKDQGQCGSCYSFSATEAVETAFAIKKDVLTILAPQQVVDCSKLNNGCNGGMPDRVFKYFQSNAACSSDDYPYVSGTTTKEGTCHSCTGIIPKLSKYIDLKSGDENSMLQATLVNSLSVGICASDKQFQLYSSGVLDFNCCTETNHAVVVEGFSTENSKDYWIVRNSWGTSWGDKGYVKMARGKNLCTIASMVSYPVF